MAITSSNLLFFLTDCTSITIFFFWSSVLLILLIFIFQISSLPELTPVILHWQDQTNQAVQTNINVYPDWTTMQVNNNNFLFSKQMIHWRYSPNFYWFTHVFHFQAYYGPRVTLPPYYSPSVASSHAPHPYMWGPPQVFYKPSRRFRLSNRFSHYIFSACVCWDITSVCCEMG